MDGEGGQQRGGGGPGGLVDETGLEAYVEVERPGRAWGAWRGLGRRGPTPFPTPGPARVLHLVLGRVPCRVLPSQTLVRAKCTLSQSPVNRLPGPMACRCQAPAHPVLRAGVSGLWEQEGS